MMRRLFCLKLFAMLIAVGCGMVFAEAEQENVSGPVQFPTYAPLWAIGHRNLHKNQVLIANRFVHLQGDETSLDTSIMTLRYGVTDHLTTFAYLPVIYHNEVRGLNDSGLGNFSMNAEYMFFEKEVGEHRTEATLLGEISFPTATTVTNGYPLLDVGAYRFLVGTTGEYGTMYSYFYYSLGAVFFTQREGKRLGNEFLYEWGFAPVLYHSKDHDLFLYVDWNGRYLNKTEILGQPVIASGGNIVYMGTALEYRYKNMLMYISYQAPVQQSLSNVHIDGRTSFYINVVF